MEVKKLINEIFIKISFKIYSMHFVFIILEKTLILYREKVKYARHY